MNAQVDPTWWDSAAIDGRAMPQVLAERDVGAVFRFLHRRGFSRARIAALTGLSETRVREVWHGRQQVSSYEVLERIAGGLRIPRGRMGLGLTGQPLAAAVEPSHAASATGAAAVPGVPGGPYVGHPSSVHAFLPDLRRLLDAHDLPADGPVRPIVELRASVAVVVRMRLDADYAHLVITLPQVVPELHRAMQTHLGQRQQQVARLLVQTYRAADAVADKFGLFDLSARIIALMTATAQRHGDELLRATAAYVRAETFFANGDLRTGRHMLHRAAERLAPDEGVEAAAAFGALHMRAAVMAARCGDAANASGHLDEAGAAAALTPEGVYAGTAFGPASVRIHQVTLAVDLGDEQAALRAADAWSPPPGIPAERRSHFYVDLARAQAAAGQRQQVLDTLCRAREAAPQHIRAHPDVHTLVGELRQRTPNRDTQLTAFADWLRSAGPAAPPTGSPLAGAGPAARSTSR